MKTQSKELTDEEKKLLELVRLCGGGQTWWMSRFYEKFCTLYNLDENDIESNAVKIRYRLNKLKKQGYLKTQIRGTGEGGKSLFNSTKATAWIIIN